MEKHKVSFLNEISEQIKKNFVNRAASSITIFISALIGAAIAYVGGALAFQYTAADKIFEVEAAISSIQDELKDNRTEFNDFLSENGDNQQELILKGIEFEKRLDRMETKLDQLLLR